MINDVKESFYYLWLSEIPDEVINGAICEVEKTLKAKEIKASCRNLYDNWLLLNTVTFLMTFFGTSENIEIEIDGKKLKLNNLSEDGINKDVKKMSIDANITTEYFEAKLPKGKKASDFPYGKIQTEIDEIEATCNLASTPYSYSRGANCGMG